MKLDHVLAEADQHLRRGLASDAAVEVGLTGKIFIDLPEVGDGVAEEDDAVLADAGGLEGGVGVTVAGEFAEIIGVDCDAGGSVLIEAGVAGGGDGGLLGERQQRALKTIERFACM